MIKTNNNPPAALAANPIESPEHRCLLVEGSGTG